MLHNQSYNPKTISWVNENIGVFKVNNTSEFARTWGLMKSNRSEEMNYEKMSRAMRYYYDKNIILKTAGKRYIYRFICDIQSLLGYTPEEVHAMVGIPPSTVEKYPGEA